MTARFSFCGDGLRSDSSGRYWSGETRLYVGGLMSSPSFGKADSTDTIMRTIPITLNSNIKRLGKTSEFVAFCLTACRCVIFQGIPSPGCSPRNCGSLPNNMTPDRRLILAT